MSVQYDVRGSGGRKAESFADRLRALRESRGWSAAEAARQIGVRDSVYARWEDKTEPTVSSLMKIASAYRMSLDDLVGYEAMAHGVPVEFDMWLNKSAPKDLKEHEREWLESHRFPVGKHSGVEYYSFCLWAIRAGIAPDDAIIVAMDDAELQQRLEEYQAKYGVKPRS